MIILKNKLFLSIVAAGAVFSGVYFGGILTPKEPQNDLTGQASDIVNSPEPTASLLAEPTTTPKPTHTPTLTKTPVPLPTGDGQTTFVDLPVPWALLSGGASCKLQGEIKFIEKDLYNNQDARFIYSGVDNPARNIFWTIAPDDNLSVGPNMFVKTSLPNGESLLSIVLPENPKSKTYSLTAKIQYGRLVDEKGNFITIGGNVKVFEKQCEGKTTIVLPD